jgi:ring-1,2-phenylacetyl-CoA epoxidase subunit PaaC
VGDIVDAETESEVTKIFAEVVLAMADDELILAHRNSEWTGHSPILEEDIAFSNIAQDELGHATLWYQILSDITGEKPDDLVFFRDSLAYRNVQMVEMPNGDWAYSMMRQYLFDAYERIWLAGLIESTYQPVAEAAKKIWYEEIYHYRHTSSWIKRLGLGTEESNNRCQSALNQLWPYAFQLFASQPEERIIFELGYVPDRANVRGSWLMLVLPFLEESGLNVPVEFTLVEFLRSEHSEHLARLLTEMQEVARSDPEADW